MWSSMNPKHKQSTSNKVSEMFAILIPFEKTPSIQNADPWCIIIIWMLSLYNQRSKKYRVNEIDCYDKVSRIYVKKATWNLGLLERKYHRDKGIVFCLSERNISMQTISVWGTIRLHFRGIFCSSKYWLSFDAPTSYIYVIFHPFLLIPMHSSEFSGEIEKSIITFHIEKHLVCL